MNREGANALHFNNIALCSNKHLLHEPRFFIRNNHEIDSIRQMTYIECHYGLIY
jgi:hypothetical protein